MNNKKILRRYYESELNKIKVIEFAPEILKPESIQTLSPKKFSWEDVFGCIITAGYLFPFLIPERWFSFGKFLFTFRFGF